MSSWHSYPSIWNLSHAQVGDLLSHPCYVEEKIDGSQVSFGLVPEDKPEDPLNPKLVLRVRSKGAEMWTEAPEKMFTKAVETAQRLADANLLHPHWTYRGEFLRVPKHNTLAYNRTPNGNIILFDVTIADGVHLGPDEKRTEAARIGLECVPVLADSRNGLIDETTLRTLLDHTTSVLGGQLIEGVVVKQLGPDFLYGRDKKLLLGKFVSERFREEHRRTWKNETQVGPGLFIERLAGDICTPARWRKAVQNKRDSGTLTNTPADIGPLMKLIPEDVKKECEEEIKQRLFEHFWPELRRKVTRNFPEWYKEELLKDAGNNDES